MILQRNCVNFSGGREMFGDNRNKYNVNGQIWSIDNQKAILYFFTPRDIPDQNIRPLLYTFDEQITYDLDKTIQNARIETDKSIGGTLGGDVSRSFVKYSDSANRWIKPGSECERFKTKFYTQNWTFILVIDNAELEGRHRRVKVPNRLFYSGFCIGDEPVIRKYGKNIFNENCVLVATHFTQLNVQVNRDARGEGIIVKPQLDIDIVVPRHISENSRNREYLLTPQSLTSTWSKEDLSGIFGNGYEEDYDQVEYDTPSIDNIRYAESNIILDTAERSPKYQVGRIVDGICSTINKRYTNRLSSNSFGSSATPIVDPYLDRRNFCESVQRKYYDSMLGIDINKEIYLTDLLRKYDSLYDNTIVCNIPFDIDCDLMDDGGQDPLSVWSSLINSAVPGIMGNWGISDCSFRYASYNPNRRSISLNKDEDVVELIDMVTFIQDSRTMYEHRWFGALDDMRIQLFDLIKTNCGEFEVFVNYRSAGECAVQLQLIDIFDNTNDEYVVTNGLLGGLTTSVIGSAAAKDTNADSLASVIETVMSVDDL